MPSIGLGTWLAEPGQVKNAVTHVLRDLEYLHIDAAMIYFNEEEVGQGMLDGFAATKLTRKDVWLTSKLWNDCHHPDHVIDACKDSISKLKTDYLDLYLIHFPASFQKGIMDAERSDQMTNEPIEDTWKEMEKLVDMGLCKNIGVSNFPVPEIMRILAMPDLKYKPQVNQLEVQPYYQRRDILRFCQQRGIVVTAHTSLGGGANPWVDIHPAKLLDDPVVAQIAKEASRSTAQVLLKWGLQSGLSVIPKSVNNDRLKQNHDLMDFELTGAQMADLNALDKGDAGCFNHPVTPWLGRSLFQDELEVLSK
jgi:alcohol dehydrogenase (NADP+)